MVNGILRLLDDDLATPLKTLKYTANVLGKDKAVYLDVRSLKRRIEKKVPSQYLEKNPLWTMIV